MNYSTITEFPFYYFVSLTNNTTLVLHKNDIKRINVQSDTVSIETLGESVPPYKQLGFDVEVELFNNSRIMFKTSDVSDFLNYYKVNKSD